MNVQIAGIGSFDVLIQDVTEHEALKAIDAVTSPKLKAAFQLAVQRYQSVKSAAGNFSYVTTGTPEQRIVEMYDGSGQMIAAIRYYQYKPGSKRKGYWQAFVKPIRENIRRTSLEELKGVIAAKVTVYNDKLTRYGSEAEDLL